MIKLWLCLKAIVMWPYPKNSSTKKKFYATKHNVQEQSATVLTNVVEYSIELSDEADLLTNNRATKSN